MDKFFFPICYIPFFFFGKEKITCYIYFVLCLLHLMADVSSVGHTFFFAKMLDTHIGAVQLVIFISSPLFVAFDDA
jgi:hypothetical protein